MSDCEEYANWVLAPENAIRTPRPIKLAAERFLRDLKRADIYFDEEKAAMVPLYCEKYLCLWEDQWRGEPMKLAPWMKFIFGQIYGWIVVKTGKRRFTKVFVEVSKKNAKSTLAGGLINYHLTADHNISTPSVFVGANNETQAHICLKITGKIIEQSPALIDWINDGDLQLFYAYGEINKIVLHPNNERDNREGSVTALSKEGSDRTSKTSGGKHGQNPSLVVIDEFGLASDDNQLNDMESGQGARSEPLLFVITTSGFNLNGPCYTKLRKTGLEILEGTMEDDSYLPVIYELDKPIGADGKPKDITIDYLIENEQVWEQANPNIDISVQRDFLRRRLIAAKNEGGTKEVDVLTLNFNQWVGSAVTFIPADIWNRNTHGLSLDDLSGEYCYGGIEIVSAKGVNAFSFIFPNVQGHVVIRTIYWMPDESSEKITYHNWAKDGHVKTFLGNVPDNDQVLDYLVGEILKYEMHSFAYKNTLTNSDIVQGLLKEFDGYPISHGYAGIGTPTLMWEELITSGNCEHFNNPVMAWNNGNCLVKRKENDIRLEKVGSNVVGIYAALNALAQWKTVEAEDDEAGIDYIDL